jgi:hypothetical protein
VSLSLHPHAALSAQEREFISTIYVNLPWSTFTRPIRVIDYRSSATRNFWHRNYHSKARSFFLGSIATGKYVDVLLASFRDRLRFPSEFIGRGDMSRGGLMLRCAVDRHELSYIAVAGAIVNGKRPPREVFDPKEPRRFRVQGAQPPDSR